jgi:uncharacterized delta-60 repeat protein
VTPLRHILLATVLAILALSALSGTAGATPLLDNAFGQNGSLTPRAVEGKNLVQEARGIAVQRDGKIVVPMALSINFGQRWHRPIVRYNANGTLDGSFGRAGTAWVRVSGNRDVSIDGIDAGPNGDSYVSGFFQRRVDHGPVGLFIAHLNSNGSQDMSFGEHGAIRIPLGYERYFLDVDSESDGSIYVSEVSWTAGRHHVATLRFRHYTRRGRPDQSFADHGVRRIAAGKTAPTFAAARDGVAYTESPEGYRGACQIRRYVLRDDGRRDLSFGSGGTVRVGLQKDGDEPIRCWGMSLSNDGGVLVNGVTFGPLHGEAGFVLRLGADGRGVSSFGEAGVARFNTFGGIYKLIELSDGSLLAWVSILNGGPTLAVVRKHGELDTDFGTSGLFSTTASLYGPLAVSGNTAVALTSDLGDGDRPGDRESSSILKFTN